MKWMDRILAGIYAKLAALPKRTLRFILRETAPPRGRFRLAVEHRDGRRETIDDHNLVVDGGRHLLALLLAGKSTDAIAYAAIGNGSDPETPDDTSLTNQRNIPLEGSEVAGSVATFRFVVPYDEANGVDIHEFALVSAAGVMFSRRMRQQSLVKTADIRIIGAWEVTL